MHGRSDLIKVLASVVTAVAASLIATYFATQSQTETAFRERLVAVETRWDEVIRRLNTIDAKFDQQNEAFRDVLRDWARGVDRRTGEPLPLQRDLERGQ